MGNICNNYRSNESKVYDNEGEDNSDVVFKLLFSNKVKFR